MQCSASRLSTTHAYRIWYLSAISIHYTKYIIYTTRESRLICTKLYRGVLLQVWEEATSITNIFAVTAHDPEGTALTYVCLADPDDGNFANACDMGKYR